MKKIFSAVRAIQLFQIFRYGAVFIIGIIYTKTQLTSTEIGLFETFLFIVYAVSFFWISSLINGLLAVYPSRSDKEKKVVIFNTFLLMSGITLLTCTALFAFSNFFIQLFTEGDSFPFFNYLIVFVLFNNPGFLIEYILLLRNYHKYLIGYGVFIFFLQILLATVPILLGFGIEQALIGLIIFSILKFVILLFLLVKTSICKIDFQLIKEHFNISYPLALGSLLSGSAIVIDGLLIGHYFDSSTFAIYRYGAREFPLAFILANAFSSAAIPKVADNLQSSLAYIKKNSTQMMHWLFPISGILMVSSHLLFPIVFSSDFQESAAIFNVYLLLIVSRLLFPQTILNGLKQSKAIMAVAFIEITVNISLSIFFLQVFGLIGVAYATIIANLLDKFLLMIINYRRNGISPIQYLNPKVFFFYSSFLYFLYILTISA